MPPTLTFPGVYIEEVPSAVRPITGVATRRLDSNLGYAVQDFYRNGGSND